MLVHGLSRDISSQRKYFSSWWSVSSATMPRSELDKSSLGFLTVSIIFSISCCQFISEVMIFEKCPLSLISFCFLSWASVALYLFLECRFISRKKTIPCAITPRSGIPTVLEWNRMQSFNSRYSLTSLWKLDSRTYFASPPIPKGYKGDLLW